MVRLSEREILAIVFIIGPLLSRSHFVFLSFLFHFSFLFFSNFNIAVVFAASWIALAVERIIMYVWARACAHATCNIWKLTQYTNECICGFTQSFALHRLTYTMCSQLNLLANIWDMSITLVHSWRPPLFFQGWDSAQFTACLHLIPTNLWLIAIAKSQPVTDQFVCNFPMRTNRQHKDHPHQGEGKTTQSKSTKSEWHRRKKQNSWRAHNVSTHSKRNSNGNGNNHNKIK